MKTQSAKFGYIAAAIIFTGAFFKIQHWSGAGIMLVIGYSLFAFVFLPLWYNYQMKNSAESPKLFNLAVFIIALLVVLGALFKTQHWPGAGVFMILGTASMVVLVPLLIFKNKNEQDEKIKADQAHANIFITAIVGTVLLISFRGQSAEIMNSSANLNRQILQHAGNIESCNNLKYNMIERSGDKMSIDKAMQVKKLSAELSNYILKLEEKLIRDVAQIEGNIPDQYMEMIPPGQKINYDIPSHILIGDLENPARGEYSAAELKNKIIEYKNSLAALFEGENKEMINGTMGLKTDDMKGREETQKWEVALFWHVPFATVMNTFSNLKAEIKFSESQALEMLCMSGMNAREIAKDTTVNK